MRGTEQELMHYASANYDPVKAHEYYVKNRELQGRGSTENLSGEELKKQQEKLQNQVEARQYVRNQIGTKKEAELESLQTGVDARLQALTAKAQETSARIQQALKDHLASLEVQLKIPTNASPKVRAFLEKQHAKQKASAQQKSQAQLVALGKNLRTAVTTARTQYVAARKGTISKYKTMLETEDENIRNEVR